MKVFFKEIKEEIIKELNNATQSINVAVAWFTDKELFDILRRKASEGVQVNLLIANDPINHDSNIDYDSLNNYLGCEFHFIGNGSGSRNRLMHHKFCIIDDKVLVTGSYNWTIKAQFNSESISILEEQVLIQDYKTEFYALLKKEESKNRYVEKSKFKFDFGTPIANINIEQEKSEPVVIVPVIAKERTKSVFSEKGIPTVSENVEKSYIINTVNHKNLTSNVPLEKLPKWIQEAETEDAKITLHIETKITVDSIRRAMAGIKDEGKVIWEGGRWEDGKWKSGMWKRGTWKDGIWKGGWWDRGTWCGGTWEGGRWRYGTWCGGIWKRGTWDDGIWKGGIWENGTWNGGTWKAGDWKGGDWKGGWLAGLLRGF